MLAQERARQAFGFRRAAEDAQRANAQSLALGEKSSLGGVVLVESLQRRRAVTS